MIDFRVCTQQSHSVRGYDTSLARIKKFRTMMALPIGDFVWNRLLAAVDGELANQLLDEHKYTTIAEIREGIALLTSFSQSTGIALPMFLQSMALIIDYESMIANRVPFETKVKEIPPTFFVALIFAGKKKRLIRLEVSDQRLLTWAECMKVDFTKIDSASMVVDETRTEIPLSLWS
jgi:hypothetical protein